MSFNPFRHRVHRAKPQTARSIGAEIFAEHAGEMLIQTRRLLNAVNAGEITSDQTDEGIDYVGLVRHHRDSLVRKLDEDLLVLEFRERIQRAAALQELQQNYPKELATVLGRSKSQAAASSAGKRLPSGDKKASMAEEARGD